MLQADPKALPPSRMLQVTTSCGPAAQVRHTGCITHAITTCLKLHATTLDSVPTADAIAPNSERERQRERERERDIYIYICMYRAVAATSHGGSEAGALP